MVVASISEAKNQWSALLDHVRRGEMVLILRRGKPVARLVPAQPADEDDESRLSRLERAGIITRGSGKAASEVLNKKPPRPSRGGSVLKALLEDRWEGR